MISSCEAMTMSFGTIVGTLNLEKTSSAICTTTQTDLHTMNAHQLAHVSFSIAGDDLDPEVWTRYFGVPPDTAIVKGKQFMTPSGRLSSVPGRTGVWGLRSKAAVHSDSLEPHLRYLIDRLNLPRDDLR